MLFQKIRTVPTSESLIDIVLHRVTTKTQNSIHSRFKIIKIRKLYINKVICCRNEYSEKLTRIVNDFPRIETLPPFYRTLITILYDSDSLKVALSKISLAKGIIERTAVKIIKLLKYADTPFACKKLKIASLGQMTKAVKRLKEPLIFLEKVRTHFMRLPKLDLNLKTSIFCGAPNVGKSTIMKKITNAHVEVEPYPFTTRALFKGVVKVEIGKNVGKYQILDTPGILDRPFEKKNVIEMQSMTAIGHLDAGIAFCIDGSLESLYGIEGQVKLFEEVLPLFQNKNKALIFTKSDLRKFEDFTTEEKNCIKGLMEKYEISISININDKEDFKEKIIDLIVKLSKKENFTHEENETIKTKFETKKFDSNDSERNAIKIFEPSEPLRQISSKISKEFELKEKQSLLEEEENFGGDGNYEKDLRDYHVLEDENWKYDIVPEIYEGENVGDYNDYGNDKNLASLMEKDLNLRKEFDQLKNKLSKKIFDKEYKELLEKHQKEIYQMAMSRAKAIVSSKKGKQNVSRKPKERIIGNAKLRKKKEKMKATEMKVKAKKKEKKEKKKK